MQVKTASVTAIARRRQIVDAAIDTIAELGYGQASFARIAEHAGLSSTRLISYHFAGKADLVQAIIAEVYGQIGAHMYERMKAATDPASALRLYITGVVDFIADHRGPMRVLMEIFLDYRSDAGERSHDAAADQRVTEPLRDILRNGQDAGQFRAFDVAVMATTIQRAVDGLPFLLQTQPDLDLRAYATELVELFDRATRRDG